MIVAENLTKRYGRHVAVNGVSFSVKRGEIVGLLGPNGAGKSTIMRILTCFMPATSGTVRVAWFDVFSQADEVRRRFGYMPENNPLYQDMRVQEYLRFRARLKGLEPQSNAGTHGRGDRAMRIERRQPPDHRAIVQRLPATGWPGGCPGASSRS